MRNANIPDPCPICNSTSVRWRKRRIYDYAFTWTRAIINGLYEQTLGRSARTAGSVDGMHIDAALSHHIEHELMREKLEADSCFKVGKRYWKCRDCKQRGQIFGEKSSLPR